MIQDNRSNYSSMGFMAQEACPVRAITSLKRKVNLDNPWKEKTL